MFKSATGQGSSYFPSQCVPTCHVEVGRTKWDPTCFARNKYLVKSDYCFSKNHNARLWMMWLIQYHWLLMAHLDVKKFQNFPYLVLISFLSLVGALYTYLAWGAYVCIFSSYSSCLCSYCKLCQLGPAFSPVSASTFLLAKMYVIRAPRVCVK